MLSRESSQYVVNMGLASHTPSAPRPLRKTHIGRCGELLVQYRLLLLGIDSSPMTTDAGVDLVAYAPAPAQPHTLQVKTNLKPKPSGGRGKDHLDWWVPDPLPAQLLALVDLSS